MYTKYGTLKLGFLNFKQVFSQRCHGLSILTIHKQPQLNHQFISFKEVRNLWLTRYKGKRKSSEMVTFFIETHLR